MALRPLAGLTQRALCLIPAERRSRKLPREREFESCRQLFAVRRDTQQSSLADQNFTLDVMNYNRSIKQRRRDLVTSMGVDSPPADQSAHAVSPSRSRFEMSDADRTLLASGDREAMRRRIAQLNAKEVELDAAVKSALERAASHHAAALAAHEKIEQIFDEQIGDEFRARNKIGELLCAVFLAKVLGLRAGTVEYDCRTFDTPLGGRRIDAYLVEHRIAIESKIGYQSLTKRIRVEIEKDEYLIASGQLQAVYWLFYAASSSPLLARLKSSPIKVASHWLTPELRAFAFRKQLPPWLPI